MATMYPTFGPRECEDISREKDIYYALKALPKEYTVIHSFKYAYQHNFQYFEKESDFVIYHKDLGILCIEAKGGRGVEYKDSWWYFLSGNPLENDPYDQASKAMWNLVRRIKWEPSKGGLGIDKCSILCAVWFPTTKRSQLESCNMPMHALPKLTLSFEDLVGTPENLDAKIREIFKVFGMTGIPDSRGRVYIPDPLTDLSREDEEAILKKVLLPQFQLVELDSVSRTWTERKFGRLLDSQKRILDFLVDQRSAVINGAAGTGKTLIAVEKACRLAESGEDVLFLCFNTLLKEDLELRFRNKGVSDRVKVKTVSGLAREKTGSIDDFCGLNSWLERYGSSFGVKHVIVDEGQDFGRTEIEKSGLLDTMNLLTQEHDDGTFYVFYDQRQLVHNAMLPEAISNADCKMTLYINCRNTKSIADCSLNGLKMDKKRNSMNAEAIVGYPPTFLFDEDPKTIEGFIDDKIKKAKEKGYEASKMAVLSCRTLEEGRGVLTRHASKVVKPKNGRRTWGSSKVPFYSCREFKGLEADVVFLVDVDKRVWEKDGEYQAPSGNLFYTSASRAKHQLYVAVEMPAEDAAEVADILEGYDDRHHKKPYLKLENILIKGL